MRTFTDLTEFFATKGEHLGYSSWHTLDQEQVDLFAKLTGDEQWIHVDRERAAQGRFGGTIVHGYFTLSLLPMLSNEIFRLEGLRMIMNYGANKVRFPTPVPVGSRVRAGATLTGIDEAPSGTRVVMTYTIEAEGSDKPGCVAEVVRFLLP